MKSILKNLKEKYNKANKKKLFVSCAALFAVSLILWAFLSAIFITKNFNRNQLLGTENKQELDVSSLILVETKDDEKFWEIYAKSGNYDSDNKVAMLDNIIGNFYKDNQVSMSFESSKATYNEEKREIILYDRTHIVIKDGTSLYCDTLIWQGSDKDIIAKGNIKIEKENKLYSTAKEAVISADYTKFKIIGNTSTKLYETKEKK
jgi:LPS export ABC transporter protein LptC